MLHKCHDCICEGNAKAHRKRWHVFFEGRECDLLTSEPVEGKLSEGNYNVLKQLKWNQLKALWKEKLPIERLEASKKVRSFEER